MTSLANQTTPSESRVERKRRLTRERIVHEAERLMRTQPLEDITIGDITSAADVGHGTFYIHFKSKYEVLIPITRNMAERWDQALQQATSHLEDPAEVVAISVRYMGRAVIADPLWRWMLKHSGMPMDDMRNAIGRFAARDFGRGLQSRRFQVADLPAANSFLIGGFVTSLLASVDSENSDEAIDHMAELILRTLGIGVEEASPIAHQTLPPLATPTGELP
ncbi:MAG: TetR/AcrR family transcriptional regulator [Pseudomonadales bacterium]